MRLYIMRHGQAEPAGRGVDSERRLTNYGVEELTLATKGLLSLGVSIEMIAHSPLVRTTETAQIVGRGLGAQSQSLEISNFAPGASPEIMLKEVVGLSMFRSIMAVGHAPDVSFFSHYILSGADGTALNFKPGSIACIDFPGKLLVGSGELVWFRSAMELGQLTRQQGH